MKISTRLLSLSSLIVISVSCVNDDYDIKHIENVNTDISFGGDEFGMPIGSLAPVKLGNLIKETNLIRLVDGQYELQNQSRQEISVPYINPISITPNIPTIAASSVTFDEVSLSDILLPTVSISAVGSSNITESIPNVPVTQSITIEKRSPISIGYTYSKELKQINWVEFGSQSSTVGDLVELNINPDYGNVLTNSSTTIDIFTITFPYGFELGLPSPNTYNATLSADKKSITIINQTLTNSPAPIKFYVQKVTFNPAIDQTEVGHLDYEADITYSSKITLNGTSTGRTGALNVTFGTSKKLTIFDGNFNTNDIKQDVDVTSSIAINEPLSSSEIKSISNIVVAKDCKINLRASIEGLPSWVTQVNLSNYTIQFPKFLVFKAGQGITADNKATINRPISTATGLNESYEIEGFVFDKGTNPIKNGAIEVNGQVEISGAFVIPQTNNIKNTDVNGVRNILLKPSVTIDPITIETVTGIIDPKIDISPINIEIELGSDMSFIESSTLDLTKTAIQVIASNPAGVTADIGLTINTYDQLGGRITQITQPSGLVIKSNTTSNIWLSNSSQDMPSGFTYVENLTLPSIFKRIPNRMEVLLTASTGHYESEIDMANQSNAPMVFVCNIIAPLNVGSGFELAYSETVKEISSSIGDYLKYATELVLNINTSSNIPLHLALQAVPRDKNGAPLSGVTMAVDGLVAAGTKEGAFCKSQMSITLKETRKGELSNLDQIELSFKGNASQALAGAPLKPTQELQVSLSAKIPGGINIKQ